MPPINQKSKQDELLDILINEKLITTEKLAEVRTEAQNKNKSIYDVLVKREIVDSEKLAQIKAKIFNFPHTSLIGKEIKAETLSIISPEVAKNYKIICFSKEGNKIKVGLIDPVDFKAVEAVNFLAREENLEVEYYIISEQSFRKALKQYKSLDEEVITALGRREKEKEEDTVSVEGEGDAVQLKEVVKSAPVVKIVSVIIRHAVEGRASDIHIEPTRKESRVRFRIDGILHTSLSLPINVHTSIIARIKVLARLKLDETRIPQDGRIRIEFEDRQVDFRISTLPLLDKEKVVMRLLDISQGIPKLDELGFLGNNNKIINSGIKSSSGMFLITGPTGSGKSTTLASILSQINSEEVNIVTLEDPIEYFIKGINQSQINPDIGFSFASGLRSLLRQDPDIIMVGEVRDNETAELAIHAGLTGHFILSTLHTNDAFGAIPRLVDMKIEPFLLASTLKTIVAQRLVRRICKHCKIEDKIPDDVLAEIKDEAAQIPQKVISQEIKNFDINNLIFYKGKGCPRCSQGGYKGRVGIVEVIEVNKQVKEMIMEKHKFSAEDILKNQNFINMRQDGIMKALQGVTSLDEILRVLHV